MIPNDGVHVPSVVGEDSVRAAFDPLMLWPISAPPGPAAAVMASRRVVGLDGSVATGVAVAVAVGTAVGVGDAVAAGSAVGVAVARLDTVPVSSAAGGGVGARVAAFAGAGSAASARAAAAKPAARCLTNGVRRLAGFGFMGRLSGVMGCRAQHAIWFAMTGRPRIRAPISQFG
ncbi:hypothetical protein ASG71_07675 [Arthrobacter sp. Soil763]|nr:hypothetical protein ASG71_07675 [Arthrobacter sp. Soil763]